jgi:hypothetical protein
MAKSPIPVFAQPSAVDAYQAVYDALFRAYWDASDMETKDLIQGARDHVYDIITELNEEDLAKNAAAFAALSAKVKEANVALTTIKDQIGRITKNLSTVSSVVAAITKALQLAAMFP